MKKWFIKFPTYQYNEDVKELARVNRLKIVDSAYQGSDSQCENAPSLTLKKSKVESSPKVAAKRVVKPTLIDKE